MKSYFNLFNLIGYILMFTGLVLPNFARLLVIWFLVIYIILVYLFATEKSITKLTALKNMVFLSAFLHVAGGVYDLVRLNYEISLNDTAAAFPLVFIFAYLSLKVDRLVRIELKKEA